LAGGATCTITFGATTSGGPGATAPAVLGPSTFAAQSKSIASGTLTNLASSPSVQVVVMPAVALDASAVSIAEGGVGATTSAGLHAVLSAPSPTDVTVHVSISGGSATPGTDTSTLDTNLTITAGLTSVVVPLNVLGDELVEGDETTVVTMSLVSGTATLGSPAAATVTITDDDVATVTINSPDVVNGQASITEGAGGGGATLRAQAANPISQITLTIDHPSAHDITINVKTVDGTATSPADYTPIDQGFTIPAGQLSVGIPLHAVADGIVEGDEGFTVHFVSAVGATLNAGDIAVTIIDGDQITVTTTPTTTAPGTGTTVPGGGTATTTPGGVTPGTITIPVTGLPATGSQPLAPLAAGGILLLFGGTLVAARRRPRRS